MVFEHDAADPGLPGHGSGGICGAKTRIRSRPSIPWTANQLRPKTPRLWTTLNTAYKQDSPGNRPRKKGVWYYGFGCWYPRSV